ncbi:arabinofuranosyltransferase [Nocardia lijiangensis]|uniref:arabinofuranosyltransferase n=1 Tax=Nocardia lijiangensis TaxID=299618 RepID=UPI003D719B5E
MASNSDFRSVPGSVPDGGGRGWRRAAAALAGSGLAAGVALLVAAIGLKAESSVQWPAYTTSNVLRALTTFGQASVIAVLCTAVVLARAGVSPTETVWERWAPGLAKLLSWIGISGLVTITIGMPLAATRLYLSGLSPDQQWRSELLGRFADSPAWRDGTYLGLPPDEAVGWYWLVGRATTMVGIPGWEALKLSAIFSISVAAVLALVWWSRLLRADVAIVVAAATTAMALYAAPNPAFTVCLLLLSPALVAAWSALRGAAANPAATAGFTRRATNSRQVWARLLGVGAYLGLCAVFDQSAFVVAASAVTALALLAVALPMEQHAGFERRKEWRGALGRWLVLAAMAVVTVTLVWGPYLRLRGLSQFTEVQVSAAALGAAVRVVLTAAGLLVAVATMRVASAIVSKPEQLGRVAAAVGVIGSVWLCQQIPDALEIPIAAAYSDTDGKGVRADDFPTSAVHSYQNVDKAITEATTRPRRDSVLLTGDTTLLAIYPYSGFLGQSARYSNPLANYDSRVRQIRDWAALGSPEELIAALDASPLPAPTVFVLRRSGSDYLLRSATDPGNDNGVSRIYTTIAFPATLFDEYFTRAEVGPFTVLVRR